MISANPANFVVQNGAESGRRRRTNVFLVASYLSPVFQNEYGATFGTSTKIVEPYACRFDLESGRGPFPLGGGRSIQLSYADIFNFWLISGLFEPSGATRRCLVSV